MFRYLLSSFLILLVTGCAIPISNGINYNGVVYCNEGYYPYSGVCLESPQVANGHFHKGMLHCDEGYREEFRTCFPKVQVTQEQSDSPCEYGGTVVDGKCVWSTLHPDGSVSTVTKPLRRSPKPESPDLATAASASTSMVAADSLKKSGDCAENGSCYGDISSTTGAPKTIHVKGYYRKDGTYVRGHYRSRGRRK